MRIAEINATSKNVEVTGFVAAKGETRTVNLKTGGQGKVADLTLVDDSGSIQLSLWNEDIDKVALSKRVKITGGYVSTYKGAVKLSKGKFGKLEVL